MNFWGLTDQLERRQLTISTFCKWWWCTVGVESHISRVFRIVLNQCQNQLGAAAGSPVPHSGPLGFLCGSCFHCCLAMVFPSPTSKAASLFPSRKGSHSTFQRTSWPWKMPLQQGKSCNFCVDFSPSPVCPLLFFCSFSWNVGLGLVAAYAVSHLWGMVWAAASQQWACSRGGGWARIRQGAVGIIASLGYAWLGRQCRN